MKRRDVLMVPWVSGGLLVSTSLPRPLAAQPSNALEDVLFGRAWDDDLNEFQRLQYLPFIMFDLRFVYRSIFDPGRSDESFDIYWKALIDTLGGDVQPLFERRYVVRDYLNNFGEQLYSDLQERVDTTIGDFETGLEEIGVNSSGALINDLLRGQIFFAITYLANEPESDPATALAEADGDCWFYPFCFLTG